MTREAYFEELSYALRRRELLPRPVEEDGLLPVEWNGRILCRVTDESIVRFDPAWVDTERAKAALKRVTEAAGTVMEYMTLMEAAPPLKATGLEKGYLLLADFNGAVLAVFQSLSAAYIVFAVLALIALFLILAIQDHKYDQDYMAAHRQ